MNAYPQARRDYGFANEMPSSESHRHRVVFEAAMMQTFDPVCFDAFARLLAQPDPTDLPRRAHTLRCEGDPDRRATRLPGILMGWLQRRHLTVDVEEPIASATRTWTRRGRRTNPDLRVLRPTASASGMLHKTRYDYPSLRRSSPRPLLP